MSKTITGLTQTEAKKRLQHYDANSLPEPIHPGLFSIFSRQFKSPFIYVLLAATLVSLGLGQNINSMFILIVLILNATIGTFQEFAAQKAASGLEKMVPHRATVLRDAKPIVIDTAEIVPGDAVLLASGDKVPANIKLSQSLTLEIDESMLTGESLTTEKDSATEFGVGYRASTASIMGTITNDRSNHDRGR